MKKPILRAFIAISRIDEENRIVEGYAAVNEAVPGDKYKLTRAALEKATPDYETWGAVRAMHQPIAAGTCSDPDKPDLGVTWDEKGAFIRAYIADDDAWNKVLTKVYKGFSVGVRCDKIERGNEVTACTWVETSLVDRPADPDAKIMAFRCDSDEPEEPDTPRIDAHIAEMAERGAFADMAQNEKYRLRCAAFDWLYSCLIWPYPQPADQENYSAECIAEFKVFWYARGLNEYDDQFDRSDAVDLFRAVTSKDAPKRENLEGKTKKKKKSDDDNPDAEPDGDADDAPNALSKETEKKRIEQIERLETEKATLQTERDEALKRAEDAQKNLTIERDNANALQVRVNELEGMKRATKPVKFTDAPQGAVRVLGTGDPDADEAKALQEEFGAIMARAGTYTDAEQQEKAARVTEIKRILKSKYGIEVG